MKIVHIEDFFHPDAGYQINILSKHMALLGHDVTIITGSTNRLPKFLKSYFDYTNMGVKDKRFTEDYNVKIKRLNVIGYYSGRAFLSMNLYKVIESINPDIIYAHGNDSLTAMRIFLKYRNKNKRIISDSHMLDIASSNKFRKIFYFMYRRIITPIIIKKKIKIIRTVDDTFVNTRLGIPLNQCPILSFGSDLSIFHQDIDNRTIFRKNFGISKDDFIVVYAGKLDNTKGGLLLANSFLDDFEINRKIVLVVIGNTFGDYGKEVEKLFAISKNKIIRFPTQKYIDLPIFFQAADVVVFPKQCSLTFFDAQACGLPAILEQSSINDDRVSFGNGLCFIPESKESLREKILYFAKLSEVDFELFKKNAREFIEENYDYMNVTKQYMDVIQSIE